MVLRWSILRAGRAHDPAFVGGQGLCSRGATVRANLPTREQTSRQIRTARRLRGRI